MTAVDILMWFIKLWPLWSVVAFIVYQRHRIKSAFEDSYPTGYLLSPRNAPSTINQKAHLSPLSDSGYRYKQGGDWYWTGLSKEPDPFDLLLSSSATVNLNVDLSGDQITVSDPLADEIMQAAAETPFVYVELD